jgi:hypothetical protein
MTDNGSTRRFLILWYVGFSSYASVYLLVPVLPLYCRQQGVLGRHRYCSGSWVCGLVTRPFPAGCPTGEISR